MKHLCLFFLGSLLHFNTVFGAGHISLTNKLATYDVSHYLFYHIDHNKSIDIDDLLNNNEILFTENTNSPINLGVSQKPVWFTFSVHSELEYENWILEVKYPTLNKVTFYIVDQENHIDTVIYSGKDHYNNEGKSYSYSIFFQLPVKPHQTYRVFFKVETESFIILPVTIRSSSKFFDYYRNELTIFTLFYGLFLAFIVFNLMLFILTREYIYLLLTLYLFTLSINAYFMHGYGLNLFPRMDAFYVSRMRHLLFGVGSVLFLSFTIKYLDLNKYKTLFRIIVGLIVLSLIYFIALFFKSIPQTFFTKVSIPLYAFGAFICLFAGFKTLAKGEKLSIYYIVSFVFITAASIVYSLTLYGKVPFNNFTFNINLFGTLLFSLLLTIGLIEKITAIKQERLKSQFFETMVGKLNNEISEREKVEKALRESEEKFRLLFEMSPQAISITELATGKIIDSNRQMECFLEYSKEEVLNKTTLDLGIIDSRTRKAMINKIKTDGFISGFELCLRHKSGKMLDALAYMQVIDILGKQMLVSVFIDITEKKQKEQHLIQSEKELRELNATKDKFFSIIGHDLMNPFNAMMGFTRLLIESINEKRGDDLMNYAQLIDQSTVRVYGLLQNLLMWSKTQSQRISFEPSYVNAVELVMGIVDVLKGEADYKQIEVCPEFSATGNVFVDPNMISVVIRNLLSNAIKFSEKGSRVVIGFAKDDNNYCFSVTDQGKGIEPERLKTLFVDMVNENIEPIQESKLGFGLGLILSADFIKRHNGNIWAESEVGKGSTFYFTIPIKN